MSEIIRYLKKIAMCVMLFPFRLIPMRKNRILLTNSMSLTYADNPKYVAEYICCYFPGKYDLVFVVSDPEKYSFLEEKGIRVVKFHSVAYFFMAMTSAVFLTNDGGFSYLPLRKKQLVVNTWHGGGAYKKCGIYTYGDSKWTRKDLELTAKKTDLFLSTCTRFSDVMADSMQMPRARFWEIGMPRNDILFRGNEELRRDVRKKIGLKDDEKLILFAPTFRKVDDDCFKESVGISYGVDCDRVCAALSFRFGGKWRFAFRLHPGVKNREKLLGDNVLNLSEYPDMQELLLVADAMLNDFSSSMWDFMLTGRPGFMFALDMEHYIKTTDVYTPVSDWPFPAATDNDALEYNILHFDEDAYAKSCRAHYDLLGGCESGKATELVCRRIFEHISSI